MEYNGYNIITAENPNYKCIKPLGKGSIPTALTGLYTTANEAMKAIDTNKSIGKQYATKQSNG